MQHIQENTETEHTIQNTQNKQRTNTPQHTCTHFIHIYSFDLIVYNNI